ncbi:Uncharacterised protein [Kocuria rosea]|nr:Uncharacterised protein [Kocuria rosea]
MGGPMSDTALDRATGGGGEPMSQWAVEASIRITQRVDERFIAAVAAPLSAYHGVARRTGAPGVSLRLQLEADTPVAAYGAALDLLARKVLPLLEGSTLLDLKVTPDEQQPGRTDLPPPPTSVETAP